MPIFALTTEAKCKFGLPPSAHLPSSLAPEEAWLHETWHLLDPAVLDAMLSCHLYTAQCLLPPGALVEMLLATRELCWTQCLLTPSALVEAFLATR